MNVAHRDKDLPLYKAHRLQVLAGIFVEKSRELRFHHSCAHPRPEPEINPEHIISRKVVLLAFHYSLHVAAAERKEESGIDMRGRNHRPENAGYAKIIVPVGTAAHMDHLVEGGGATKQFMRDLF